MQYATTSNELRSSLKNEFPNKHRGNINADNEEPTEFEEELEDGVVPVYDQHLCKDKIQLKQIGEAL